MTDFLLGVIAASSVSAAWGVWEIYHLIRRFLWEFLERLQIQINKAKGR